MTSFSDLDAALWWLLEDAYTTSSAHSSVVVVGGWCSVLNNARHDGLHHPGTKDVDLLFEKGATAGDLSDVVSALLDSGYVASVKHGFQLIRVMEIGGKRLAFSVDLLHPAPYEIDTMSEMFSKHVDLGIDLLSGISADIGVASIGTPLLQTVFDLGLTVDHQVGSATVRMLDDAGLFISKSESVLNKKRQRDSYDLLLTLIQPSLPDGHLTERLREAATDNPGREGVRTAFRNLRTALHGAAGSQAFDNRVEEQAERLDQADLLRELVDGKRPVVHILDLLDEVLGDTDPFGKDEEQNRNSFDRIGRWGHSP